MAGAVPHEEGSRWNFPRHRGEGCLDPRVAAAAACHNLLRKGAPDNFQFGLAIHLGLPLGERIRSELSSWKEVGPMTEMKLRAAAN